jgi:hypothetical protein
MYSRQFDIVDTRKCVVFDIVDTRITNCAFSLGIS